MSFVTGTFQLGDLLIKPIQRIQKYHLLVKKILGYSESANAPPHVVVALRDAVLCTSIIPKNANDMMDVGRLQGFTVSGTPPSAPLRPSASTALRILQLRAIDCAAMNGHSL